ncbi:hypothetical protein M569_14531, partial [Genlisea aurea]
SVGLSSKLWGRRAVNRPRCYAEKREECGCGQFGDKSDLDSFPEQQLFATFI